MLDRIEEEHARLKKVGSEFGEFHLRILKGQAELIARVRGKRTISGFESTEFGNRVGEDEIRWWVFHHDPDITGLLSRTKMALDVAQRLKEDSASVRRRAVGLQTYSQLMDILIGFASMHQDEIKALNSYVKWLESRAPFGPSILFTYRVWGMTRRGERYIHLDATSVKGDSTEVDTATEVVFGLRSRLRPVAETEYLDLLEELSHSADPESGENTRIPDRAVVERTSIAVMGNFAEYWAFIRDSLNNIVLDCDSCLAERSLLDSVSFWQSFIRKVVSEGGLEGAWWDLKETLEYWHAPDPERRRKEVQFCERVASFANASGGLLVLGVTDSIPRQIPGIPDPERRIQAIDNSLRRLSNLESTDFRLLAVPIPAHGGVCLVVAIARTQKVIEVRDERGA